MKLMNRVELIVAIDRLLEDYLHNPGNLEQIDVCQWNNEDLELQITDVHLISCLESIFGVTSLIIKANYKEVKVNSINEIRTQLNEVIDEIEAKVTK